MGLAGFMGIVGTLRARREGGLTDREKLHISVLLPSTVIVMFLAFVPTWLRLLPGAQETIWMRSMWVLFGAHIASWVIGLAHMKRGHVVFREFPPTEKAFTFLSIPIGIAATVVELLMALGHFEGYAPFAYQGVLMLFLSFGVFNFFSLLLGSEG